MTTNATPPVETAKDKENLSTDPAKDATLNPEESPAPVNKYAKPAEPVVPAKPEDTEPAKDSVKPEDTEPTEAVEEKLTFHKDKFAQFEFVKMRLKKTGCMQYDPQNPELVLDTADKRGKTLPLTPFFKSRIGITLELVFK
jgi:hypothetical protein